MEKGINSNTRYNIKYIGKERLSEIDEYIKEILFSKEVITFANKEEIEKSFTVFLDEFYERTSIQERASILSYTGLSFRKVNDYLRGIWNYEKNGKLTDEVKKEASSIADNLRKVLLKAPFLPFNMVVYRGVGISTFYSYGITKIEDLIYLKDIYLYEEGFTSTSLLRSNSFYSKQPEWGSICNIEIECLVPSESEDGVALIDNIISYSENQLEFLINSSSLFKVIDVKIDKESNKAKIKTILIPQKLWNPLDYDMERSSNKLT